MKVGFTLMPIALEGLGRISHLINIDTVEDLVILMKTVLTGNRIVFIFCIFPLTLLSTLFIPCYQYLFIRPIFFLIKLVIFF